MAPCPPNQLRPILLQRVSQLCRSASRPTFMRAAEVLVEIDSGHVHGAFPPRALRWVLEWRSLHLSELQEDWQRCQVQEPLIPIAPLE